MKLQGAGFHFPKYCKVFLVFEAAKQCFVLLNGNNHGCGAAIAEHEFPLC